jgi:hypothetical protein
MVLLIHSLVLVNIIETERFVKENVKGTAGSRPAAERGESNNL